MGSKTNKEHVNRYRVWSQAVLGEAWGSVQSDALGGRQTLQLGVRCRSVTAAGGGVGDLSVSKVSRLSRSGKELAYFQVVGPMTAINSLEAHRHVLKSRGWRVGWGDGVAQGNEWWSWGARRTPAPYRQ